MAPGSPPRDKAPVRVHHRVLRPVLPRRQHSPFRLFCWTVMFVAVLFFSKVRPPGSIGQDSPTTDKATRTVIVLDESGSMHLDRERVITAMNDFIVAQQSEGTNCLVTFIKFNNQAKIILEDVPMSELRLLTENDYQPNGGTALFDALGTAINKFQKEKDLLLVVMTDGEENASEHFDQAQIKQLVDRYTSSEFRWNLAYLAAAPRLQMQGESLGIQNNPAAGQSNAVYEFDNLSEMLSQRNSAFHKRARSFKD